MKHKAILVVLLLLISQINIAQTVPFYKSYDWDKTPNYIVAKGETASMKAMKEKLVTEFFFEEESLVEYFLEHKTLWLNSDDKIEDYNKIYLPLSANSSLVENKARVITSDGEIINLDESKILTAEDEETGKKYKYYALEGITKGSFIEYLYVEKRYPLYKGIRLNLQSSYDKEKMEFDLFSPKNLVFKFKSINKLPDVKEDTTIVDKRHWSLSVKDLQKIENENQSAYNASKGGIIYKLDKNTFNNAADFASYSKVSQNLYEYYYADVTKKVAKQVAKIISELKLKKEESEEEEIRKVDYYIKTNIYITEGNDKDLSNLSKVLEKRVANYRGIVKLYVALFKELGIKHELVLTSDRRKIKFDKEFEANNFLNSFLIYFPKIKMYLSPDKFESRFGFPPAYNTDNYGLFIKEVKVGSFKSAVGKIKYIAPVTSEKTFDTMTIDVTFNEENISENNVHYEREFNGYYAMAIQPFMHLVKGEEKEKLIDGIVESVSKEIEVTNRKVMNDAPALFGIKPLIFIVDFTTEALVENAGRKYLFKLGDLIGPQVQLYQDKKRTLSLEEEYQRSYYRKINIKIPKGYKISNLNDIIIDNSYEEDGKELFSFKSSYKLSGDMLTIHANEHYRKNIIKVPLYEEYRKVINSAANFNKIVLLLEPI